MQKLWKSTDEASGQENRSSKQDKSAAEDYCQTSRLAKILDNEVTEAHRRTETKIQLEK